MTDWADEKAEDLMKDGGFIYDSPAPAVAQALRDVRAAERARCSIWLRLIIEYGSEHDIRSASIDILGGILAKIESGDVA